MCDNIEVVVKRVMDVMFVVCYVKCMEWVI